MNNNLKLVINNAQSKRIEDKHFFEKNELKDYFRFICENGF